MTQYTISQASRITGKSRTTISSHIRSGKLSSETIAGGKKLIDASELIRVYGDVCDFEVADSSNEKPHQAAAATTSETLQLKTLKEERKREQQQLEDQIEHLKDALKLSQEGHNKATLLLEHHTSGGGGWEQSLKALEHRMANQEQLVKDEQEKHKKIIRQNKMLKQALSDEKNKTFWQRLFNSQE